MCRDSNHGGRRCPHDTSAARRIRRHRHELVTAHGPPLAARPAAPNETSATYPKVADASLTNIDTLKADIARLDAEYQRIYNDPFSIWDTTPYHFEDQTYTDSVHALAALDAAIEQRIITAGDNIVTLALAENSFPETAVSHHIHRRLTDLADEKDTILAGATPAAVQAEIATLTTEITANEQARRIFEHDHRATYPPTNNRALAARIRQQLKTNPDDQQALELQRTLDGFQTRAADLGEALRVAKNRHDPRLAEIDAEVRALLGRTGQVEARIGVMLRAQAHAYQRILSQVRPFGGADTALDSESDDHTRTMLAAAFRHYPSAWITASNMHGKMHGSTTDTRAHYREQRQFNTKPAAPNIKLAELTIDHGEDGFDPRPGFATALHEVAHRFEFSGPKLIARMEEQFLKRRTTHDGVREQLQRIHPNQAEFGYFDRFVNDYMGKIYEGSRSREILSMGMESIFAGSQGGLVGAGGTRQDPEMKRFILGLLATV